MITTACDSPWCADDGVSVALTVIAEHVTWTFETFALAVPLPLVTVQFSVGLDGCVSTVTLYVLPALMAWLNVELVAPEFTDSCCRHCLAEQGRYPNSPKSSRRSYR